MDQHLVFLLLGLANGAVFASLALALVVTYRSSGVINFATAAVAMLSAYMYAFLRNGELLLLIPGLPKTVSLGTKLGFWPAALIAVAFSCAFSLVLYLLLFRPLRTAPPVAKAVASLGVMITVTGLVQLRIGTSPVNVLKFFPIDNLALGPFKVSADRLAIAGTVIGMALILGALYQFTRFGLRTRAAAETEKGAYASGISPDRIAALNWLIAGGVAGIAGILIAPISPLVPYSYSLFIVPALAAAIVGGFRRISVAVAAGLAIGMLQSEASYLKTLWTWLPASGVPELIPLILILLVLVIWAKPLPSRGAILQPELGRAPRPKFVLVPGLIATGFGVLALVVLQGSWRTAVVTSFIFGIIALSLVVVTGYAGQVSLAQLTLAGVAGFLVAILGADWGIPFPIAPLLAALGAMLIGVIVGLPALRIRGLPVAIVTLSLAVALQAVWFRNSDFVPTEGKNVKQPTLFGLDLGPGSGADFPRLPFALLVLAVLVAVAVGVALLRRSRLGSAMLAVRTNERSAAASGINVVATKLAAFAIGAFIAGLGGSLLAYKLGNVTFDSFDVLLGLGLFATVYLIGITSVSGGIVAGFAGFGGLLYFSVNQWFSVDQYWFQIVSGVLLIVSVVLNPEGAMNAIHKVWPARGAPERAGAEDAAAAAAIDVADAAAPARADLSNARPLLEMNDIQVRYGGVVAVQDVTFSVPEGAIVGLIGPNGAGKTTLVDAITGFTAYDGSVRLDGTALDGRPAYRRTRSGLGRTFQGLELWTDLTVEENVLVGHGSGQRTPEELDRLFTLLGLDGLRERLAGELSQGQRQMVSIARALVGNPTVLLLDEPAAGLDTAESVALGLRLRDIRNSGSTILMVDHDMELVLNLCDVIHVLDFGRIIASGPPETIRNDPAVAAAYLGTMPATAAEAGV